MKNNYFDKYKNTHCLSDNGFFKNKTKKIVFPGEHHFVSMCLIPTLLKNDPNFFDRIIYVNPDGTKNIGRDAQGLICDLTIRISDNADDVVGLEVKYSKNEIVKFTITQLECLREFWKNEKPNLQFLGVLSILNVGHDSKCKIVFIDNNTLKNALSKSSTSDKLTKKLQEKVKDSKKNSTLIFRIVTGEDQNIHTDVLQGTELKCEEDFLKIINRN